MLTILSVDLAARRYRDVGIAVLSGSRQSPEASFVDAVSLGLAGEPDPHTLAVCLAGVASEIRTRFILLDGPQGWKSPRSTDPHMRLCERATRTPGKTGIPGVVKPRSWTRMAAFSIAVFDELHQLGWPRFVHPWAGDNRAVESFPTRAWRTLGLASLPAKANREADVVEWSRRLADRTGLRTDRPPSHDELQAAVAGLAGFALADDDAETCEVAGQEPFDVDGVWHEGYIISPRWPVA